jgi:hypothetical protein
VLDIQMAVSRDGIHWHRLDRRPYIELGPEGSLDSGSLYIAVGWVRSGGEIYQYYSGLPTTHAEYTILKRLQNLGAIFRVVQRLDGFVSADSDYRGGTLTTPLITFAGDHLELNAKTSSTGAIRVELRDETGHPIEGYTSQDCDELLGNYLAKTITWNGRSDLSRLAGNPVQLHFQIRNAKLYAFQFK